MRSSILARILGFRQRIIPEPRVHISARVPSRGSQAQGTRLMQGVMHVSREALGPRMGSKVSHALLIMLKK